jgi:adenine-specific DNA-methyltransferase
LVTNKKGNRVPSEQLRDAQTHFVELMTELFQLDEAEALDFGIYRVIRHRNRAVRDFLGNIETHGDHKQLVGGKLQAILEAEFAATDAEGIAQTDARLRQLEGELGLQRHMGDQARDAKLTELAAIPALAPKVGEYRDLLEQRAAASRGGGDRLEVLNRLYQFFDRHYQDGDFIVQRRYGHDAQRYIRSTGEDTEFRWATEDMYYIKSGDIFTDWPVKLAHGERVVFAVDAETLAATRKDLKPNDKAHYELKAVTQDGGGWRVALDYKKGAARKSHDEAIVAAIVAKTHGDAADIGRWLKRYAARNQSDFFIHKRLGEALNEELDIFLKTDVLDASQLLEGGDRALAHARVARAVRNIGRQIIAFLAALEDFQKSLWEKKKLVLETRYIVTLDRIEKLAGRAWLEAHLPEIVKRQREEWKQLGLGEYKKPKDCERPARGDLLTSKTTKYLPLPVDTGNFDDGGAFKWELLAAIDNLSASLDGILIHSDNWQALNTIRTRFQRAVDCTYIDPPYNAKGTSEIPYKNSYKDASWVTMMRDRISASNRLSTSAGVLEVAIDENESANLEKLLQRECSTRQIVAVAVQHNRRGIQGDNFSYSSEWMYVVHPPTKGALRDIPRDPQDYTKDNFRNWGDESDRTDARTCFYPVLVSRSGDIVGFGDVADDAFHPGARTCKTKDGFLVWPIDNNGEEKKWRYARDTVEGIKGLLSAEFVNDVDIEIKKLKVSDRPKTIWDKKSYHAGDYGTKVLTSLFGKAIKKTFQFPKSLNLVVDALQVGSPDNGVILDYFVGSGTTAHAVLELRRTGKGSRTFVVCEVNQYVNSLVIPRIKKVAASGDWQSWNDGTATRIDGIGAFVEVSSLEQYEDTLENLTLDPEQNGGDELDFEDAATLLRWRLDAEAKRVFCSIDRYRSPFGYRIRRAQGAGPTEPVEVDLVESLVWLLGLDVATMRREPEGVVLTGKNRRGESVLVAFRDCDAKGSGDWVLRQMAAHPADRCYTNDPADLAFDGAQKLESIEAVFATQFGGAA